MSRYPKPDGWNGGPDGHIIRQGSAGHKRWDKHDDWDQDTENCLSFDEADFGNGGLC